VTKRSPRHAASVEPLGRLLLLEPGDGLGCFGSRREDGFRVVLQELEPVREVLRVIGARILRDAKLGAQEGRADLGDLS
jgi:hypothetical protein